MPGLLNGEAGLEQVKLAAGPLTQLLIQELSFSQF